MKHRLGNVAAARVSRTLVWVVMVLLLFSGCVRRRMTVRSNPDGALVYVDGQEIGTTPVSTPFTYYGTRQIKLVKGGFETITVKQKINTPWYEYPPLDFFSENVLPYEVRDERVLDFQMAPQQVIPDSQLIHRAEQLRGSASQGYVVPLPDRPANAIGSIPAPVPNPTPAGPIDPRYPLPPPSGSPQNLPGPQPAAPLSPQPLAPPGNTNLAPPLTAPDASSGFNSSARRPLTPPR